MGSVYYDMGFLSTDEVIECSVSDLIGQYVGQTGPKTKAQLEKALGKVLFVDEAYRLAEGHYASEAVNELIYLLTTPRYEGKMIVILAGYTEDMNNLMTIKPGLSGLFPDEIVFQNIQPPDCMILLHRELKEKRISAPFLQDTSNPDHQNLLTLFRGLSVLPSWNNARDIKTLAKQMSASAFREMYKMLQTTTKPTLSPEDDLEVLLSPGQALLYTKKMFAMQYDRCMKKKGKRKNSSPVATADDQAESHPVEYGHNHDVPRKAHKSHHDILTKSSGPSASFAAHIAPQNAESTSEVLSETQAPPQPPLSTSRTAQKQDVDEKEEKERQESPLSTSCTAQKQEVDEKEEKEKQIQEKLRHMGVCEMGYAWTKEQGGYRCEGGSHFMSDAQLGL
jgi:hypothetical protein